jgi:hypothetical protein
VATVSLVAASVFMSASVVAYLFSGTKSSATAAASSMLSGAF